MFSFFSALCLDAWLPPSIVYHFWGGDRGYLKCSFRRTNNQLPNTFYKLIYLQLYNIKHETVYLQVVWRQIFVFRKSCLSAVYGVMDAHFLLNKKLMTCYLRDINKFLRYDTLCKSILKCGILTKSIELTRFVLFEILGVPQLWGTWFRPFR